MIKGGSRYAPRFHCVIGFRIFSFAFYLPLIEQPYPTEGIHAKATAHLDVDHSLLDIGYSSFLFRVTEYTPVMNQAPKRKAGVLFYLLTSVRAS